MLAILGALTSFIPVLGPLIDGAVAIYKNKTGTEIKKTQMDNDLTLQAGQSSNALTTFFANDPMVRACRDLIMVPGSVFCATIIWDRFMDMRHPEWVWGVKPLEGAMSYLPMALLLFFFGSAYLYAKRIK